MRIDIQEVQGVWVCLTREERWFCLSSCLWCLLMCSSSALDRFSAFIMHTITKQQPESISTNGTKSGLLLNWVSVKLSCGNTRRRETERVRVTCTWKSRNSGGSKMRNLQWRMAIELESWVWLDLNFPKLQRGLV